MKLLTYNLKINLGLPEFKWALFCYLMKVFSVGIFTTSIICKFNLIFSDLVWLLKNPAKTKVFLSRKVKFCMINLETHSYQTEKNAGR
jgi:hypothetical protein